MNDNDNTKSKDIKFAERTKPARGDSEPTKGPQAAEPLKKEQQPLQLRPFPDGAVLRHSINPRNPATHVLHDSTGTPLGVILHTHIAELICRSVTLFFYEQERQRQEKLKQLDTLTEAVVPEGPDGGTAAGQPALSVVEPNNNGTPTDVT